MSPIISKVAIGLLILGLLIGFGVGYGLLGMLVTPPIHGLVGDVTIVVLVPLSGALTTYGENSKVAAELAVKDVNAWLEEIGAGWRLKYIFEDTATDPVTALSKLKMWHGKGVLIYHQMTSSSELKECKAYADANKLLQISCMSSSAALAIPDDYIFRNIVHSLKSCQPIVELMVTAGVRHVIPTWRGDSWGDSFHDAVKAELEKRGIICHDEYGIRYDPMLTSFTVQAATLNDALTALLKKGIPKDEIGIFDLSFDEVAIYMADAATYPSLREVKWFGSDSTANVETLIKNEAAGRFAMDVKFTNPTYSPGENPKMQRVREHIKNVLARETDPYAYASYDIVWYLAIALHIVDAYDPDAVKKVLPKVVENHFGASGWFTLDKNGDRAFADYDIWVLREIEGKLTWVSAGTWKYLTGKTEWRIPIYS